MKTGLAEQAAALFRLTLTETQLEQFAQYAELLAAWNTHTNLTAITDPDAVVARHFLDSLSIASVSPMKPDTRIIDVGTGAGFPGLPLKIVFPQTQLTLLESTGKKIAFLDHVVAQLGLHNTLTLHARAEEAGHMPAHRHAARECPATRRRDGLAHAARGVPRWTCGETAFRSASAAM
jgi:16S rRNA (guanine527-N7)-methyltransferase